MERFLEFQDAWGKKYPAIVKLWSDAWAEFVPFLSFDVEIRKVICSTNAIESVNARIRKRTLPERAGRAEVCVHGADEPGSDRQGPQEVDPALEGTPQRLPDRLRGPPHPRQQLTPTNQDQPLS
jgi:putative transposase